MLSDDVWIYAYSPSHIPEYDGHIDAPNLKPVASGLSQNTDLATFLLLFKMSMAQVFFLLLERNVIEKYCQKHLPFSKSKSRFP